MKGIEQYKRSSNSVASNEQLVLRVFEKAITLMWQARESLEEGNKSSCVADLHIVRQLFSELISCLDHEAGGEMTAQLHQLYVFILKEISAAGFEGDVSKLENAISVAEQLYEGFFGAFSPDDE